MGFWMIQTLLVSLLLTLVLELVFSFVVGVREGKDIGLVVLVNVLTNPCVVLVYYLNVYYFKWNRSVVTLILEVGAVAVEALYYKRYGKKIDRPFLFSICANVFSYFIGDLISYLF